MPKFKAYVKVPADSTGKLKRIVTKTVDASSSTDALASLRGQYGSSNVNIASQEMPKHKSRIKSSSSQTRSYTTKYTGTTKRNRFKLSSSRSSSRSSSSDLVDELEKTPIGRGILGTIGLLGLIFFIYVFFTMDNNINVGVYEIIGDYRSDKVLINNTDKEIIMKDEMKNLNNKTSKYINEFNKINSSLLCKVENISKENCNFEILRYAICNYEFNQIKYKYFRSELPEIERWIDWKGRIGDWDSTYGQRYDFDIDVELFFFKTQNEQKNKINYLFLCSN